MGIGAEIVRLMQEGIGLDPRYFYDNYEGERPYELYLLDGKREQRRVEELAAAFSNLSVEVANLRSDVAQRSADHAKEVAELTRQLAEARGPRPVPPSPPTKGRPKGPAFTR